MTEWYTSPWFVGGVTAAVTTVIVLGIKVYIYDEWEYDSLPSDAEKVLRKALRQTDFRKKEFQLTKKSVKPLLEAARLLNKYNFSDKVDDDVNRFVELSYTLKHSARSVSDKKHSMGWDLLQDTRAALKRLLDKDTEKDENDDDDEG